MFLTDLQMLPDIIIETERQTEKLCRYIKNNFQDMEQLLLLRL